jgi:putative flippase GtrA
VLAVLVRWTPLHYLVATAAAVEAAVLHNFLWHQRWTWRDRPAGTGSAIAVRLARFHLTNGAISLAGNLALMRLLTGSLGIAPVPANAVAVIVCSLLNFVASDVLVFNAASAALALLLVPAPLNARAVVSDEPSPAGLRPATLAAWTSYQQGVDARYDRLSASTQPFFVHDAVAQAPGWRALAMDGQVPMLELSAPAPGGPVVDIPDGRIHHWAGVVFVPGATVAGVVRQLVERAGHESEVYDDVLASRLIDRSGDRLSVYMKLRRTSVLTVTYNTTHAVEYRRLGASRAASRSVATRIAELADAGTSREREKPEGSDRGFLWKLNAYWRYEQANGGVFIECESVSLSRAVPVLLRPFVNSTVERIARESLERTMVNVRRVLAAQASR